MDAVGKKTRTITNQPAGSMFSGTEPPTQWISLGKTPHHQGANPPGVDLGAYDGGELMLSDQTAIALSDDSFSLGLSS